MLHARSALSSVSSWFGWTLVLFAAILLSPRSSHAQAAIYGEFSASGLSGGPGGDYLYGGTLGAVVDGPLLFNRVILAADLQTRDVQINGERLLSATVGPRLSLPIKKLKLTPFGEVMIGFGRYRSGTAAGSVNTTDSLWQANGGVSRQLTGRIDVVADYGYSEYGYNDGQFNPRNFSAGIVFHLFSR